MLFRRYGGTETRHEKCFFYKVINTANTWKKTQKLAEMPESADMITRKCPGSIYLTIADDSLLRYRVSIQFTRLCPPFSSPVPGSPSSTCLRASRAWESPSSPNYVTDDARTNPRRWERPHSNARDALPPLSPSGESPIESNPSLL